MYQHHWKYFNSVLEKSVSRADFLSVLSNIEYVIIKASYGTHLQQSRSVSHTHTHTQGSTKCVTHLIGQIILMQYDVMMHHVLFIFSFRISNVTMETAVEEAPGSEVTGGVARLIESCICPTGYSGLSCQVMMSSLSHTADTDPSLSLTCLSL